MIHYDNRFWGLHLLFQTFGSAFPRALLFASLAAIQTFLLYQYAPESVSMTLKNPTLFQIFGFVVGFALVFRSSLSYNRFWEARTMLQSVIGRLSYFTIETLAADLGSQNHEAASPAERKATHKFYHELLHLVSLLFALKMKHLRKDWGLNNVYTHRMSGVPPMLDANDAVRGWRRVRVLLVRMFSLNDILGLGGSDVQSHDVPVIGGLRPDERDRLTNLVPTLEMKGRGGSINGTRTYAVFALIQQLYIRRIAEGGLKTLPPLVSRLGGIAEEGMAAFGHCAKLAATQFPFPWAQVVMVFLVFLALLLPFVVTSFVNEMWMGVVLTFVVVLTYWSLNEVASEMEDPFGYDPNDLPLARYAFDFNQGLLAAAHQLRPPYFDELDAEMAASADSDRPAKACAVGEANGAAASPGASAPSPTSATAGSGASGLSHRPAAAAAAAAAQGQPQQQLSSDGPGTPQLYQQQYQGAAGAAANATVGGGAVLPPLGSVGGGSPLANGQPPARSNSDAAGGRAPRKAAVIPVNS